MPINETVLTYLPESAETKALQAKLSELMGSQLDIPLVINGKEIRTGKTATIHPPHLHHHVLGQYHQASPEHIHQAIEGSKTAWQSWSRMAFSERAAIFLKAAELLSSSWRQVLNASTMLGQSKTCYQAEIDSACELIDFFRFNAAFQQNLYTMQPLSPKGMWNQTEYRPLEGFVFAVTPFNFTSIAGNLPTAPALMGNVSLWKPASTSVYSGYFIMKLLETAGLPPGVIQFIPGSGAMIGEIVFSNPDFAGIHFTGSSEVFQQMWSTIGQNISRYRNYPRIVGETGGKDFVFAHSSADPKALSVALIRGAYEYQGQKCSAASRAYIPKSLWPQLKEELVAEMKTITMGDVTDFRHFMSAVIDRASYHKIKSYCDQAAAESSIKILSGGKADDRTGYFIEPTLIETSDPKYRTMCDEIFGPVLSVYAYDDKDFEATLELCDQTSPYALTGAFFAQDRKAVEVANGKLRHSAGNYYLNNKPTGAVVGQQPFGGGRASGTNDKAGSVFNLMRWTSLRTISETFEPPKDYRYPFMR